MVSACGADILPTLFTAFVLLLTIFNFIFKSETREFFEESEDWVESNGYLSFFISAGTWWVVSLGAPPGDVYLIILHAYFLSWVGLIPVLILSSVTIGITYFVVKTLFVDTLLDLRKSYYFSTLCTVVNERLFYITLLVRLSYGIIPFGIANIVLSLLGNNFLTYFSSSILCMVIYSVPLTIISEDMQSLSEAVDLIDDFHSYASVTGICCFVLLLVLLCISMVRVTVNQKENHVGLITIPKRNPEQNLRSPKKSSLSPKRSPSTSVPSEKLKEDQKEKYTVEHMIDWMRMNYKVNNIEEVVENLQTNHITGKIFMQLSRNSVTDLGVNKYHAADILSRFHDTDTSDEAIIPSPRMDKPISPFLTMNGAHSPRRHNGLPVIVEGTEENRGRNQKTIELIERTRSVKERESREVSIGPIPSIPDTTVTTTYTPETRTTTYLGDRRMSNAISEASTLQSMATIPTRMSVTTQTESMGPIPSRFSITTQTEEDSTTTATASGMPESVLQELPNPRNNIAITPASSVNGKDELSEEIVPSRTHSMTGSTSWETNEDSKHPSPKMRETVYDFQEESGGAEFLRDVGYSPSSKDPTMQRGVDADDDSDSLSIDELQSVFIHLGSQELHPAQITKLWNFYDRQSKGILYKADLSSLLIGWVEFQTVEDEVRMEFKKTADERALIMIQYFNPNPPGAVTRHEFERITDLDLWAKISPKIQIDVNLQWREMWGGVFLGLDRSAHLSTESIFTIWLRYEKFGKMDIDEFELMLSHWAEEMKRYYQKEGADIKVPDSNTIRARATIGKNYLDEDGNGVVTWNEFISIRSAAFWKSVDFDMTVLDETSPHVRLKSRNLTATSDYEEVEDLFDYRVSLRSRYSSFRSDSLSI